MQRATKLRYINAKKEIVEKIVEREVIKEVRVGVSDEEMEKIRLKATEEKEMLMKQAQEDMKQLIDQQSRTAQERQELQDALDKEAEDRARMEEQKTKLANKLKMMEEKLIKGGEVISKASKQEAALRKAEIELRERQDQERTMARELAEKEEANLQLEESTLVVSRRKLKSKLRSLKSFGANIRGPQLKLMTYKRSFSLRGVTCLIQFVSSLAHSS